METDPEGLGTREYIRTLRLLESCSIPELARAVEYALDIGIHDADSIRVILEHRREAPVGLFSLDGRPYLKTVAVTAYERQSLIVTTNLPFENWTEVFGS